MINCQSLQPAYAMIKRMYEDCGLRPGTLECIGFACGWTTIDATDGQHAMAFHFNGGHAVYGQPEARPLIELQKFIGRNLFDLAEHLLDSAGLVLRSACVATLNALSCPLTERHALQDRRISCLEEEDLAFIRPDDTVTVVGYGRVLDLLRQANITFHACDLRPLDSMRTLSIGEEIRWGPPGTIFHNGAPADLLKESNVVLLTGSTLVNDTLEGLVGKCDNARVVGLFGPTGSLLPDYLLSLGVNYILSDRWNSNLSMTHLLTESYGRATFSKQLETFIIYQQNERLSSKPEKYNKDENEEE